MNYAGRAYKWNGFRTFDNWTVTVLNDETFGQRNKIMQWMRSISGRLDGDRSSTLGDHVAANGSFKEGTATITQFDKTSFKGGKTLVTIESDDGKVHMLEVTTVCAAAGTTAHATVTNSVTSDNDLVDATISVVGNNVTISLAKSSAASSSSNFTGRFTTTKVKA